MLAPQFGIKALQKNPTHRSKEQQCRKGTEECPTRRNGNKKSFHQEQFCHVLRDVEFQRPEALVRYLNTRSEWKKADVAAMQAVIEQLSQKRAVEVLKEIRAPLPAIVGVTVERMQRDLLRTTLHRRFNGAGAFKKPETEDPKMGTRNPTNVSGCGPAKGPSGGGQDKQCSNPKTVAKRERKEALKKKTAKNKK